MQTNNPVIHPETKISEQAPANVAQNVPELTQKKSGKFSNLIFIIIALISLTIAGYFAYQNYQLKQQQTKNLALEIIPTQVPQPSSTPTIQPPSVAPTVDPTANWETYTNDEYNFSLKYPDNFKINNLIEKPFYTLEDPIIFGISVTQNKYVNLAQTPIIKIQLVKTDKTINQIIEQLKKQINDSQEAMSDINHMYYGSNPPEINNLEIVKTENVEATKIERYRGPGGPNAEILEYYIKSPQYIYILTASYGTKNPEDSENEILEKETLPKIFSTFNFSNL